MAELLREFLLSWYLGKRAAAEAGQDVVAVISNGPYGWHIPRMRPEIRKIHFIMGLIALRPTPFVPLFLARAF